MADYIVHLLQVLILQLLSTKVELMTQQTGLSKLLQAMVSQVHGMETQENILLQELLLILAMLNLYVLNQVRQILQKDFL